MNFMEQSFRNLVSYYRQQLSSIRDGALSTNVFTDNERKNLKKRGVLCREVKTGMAGWKCMLTPNAERVLKEVTG